MSLLSTSTKPLPVPVLTSPRSSSFSWISASFASMKIKPTSFSCFPCYATASVLALLCHCLCPTLCDQFLSVPGVGRKPPGLLPPCFLRSARADCRALQETGTRAATRRDARCYDPRPETTLLPSQSVTRRHSRREDIALGSSPSPLSWALLRL